jgi:hypothetical protein
MRGGRDREKKREKRGGLSLETEIVSLLRTVEIFPPILSAANVFISVWI